MQVRFSTLRLLGLVPIVWLLVGTWLLMFVLDSGRINMRAYALRERFRFLALWPFLFLGAWLTRSAELQAPKHAEKCMGKYLRGACDCPTQRGDIIFPIR